MKQILLIGFLLIASIYTQAQNKFDVILENIKLNNSTLRASREQSEADKIRNKTTGNLSNPEVEFGYSWASPKYTSENEMTLSVVQNFDFPTAYRHRSQLIKEQNKRVDLGYNSQAKEIMYEARMLYVELVCAQKLNVALNERYNRSEKRSENYQKMFDNGSVNILEKNKAMLDWLNVQKMSQMSEIEIASLKAELERLNGGIPLDIDSLIDYPSYILPSSFETWLETAEVNNPILQSVHQEVLMSRKEEQLTRALNLPKLSAGYTSEYVGKESLQGFTVGVSIPLWEGKNTVKQKKVQTSALEMQLSDNKLQFENIYRAHYNKAQKLSTLVDEYRMLIVENNRELLRKAFEKGQLSIIDYLRELDAYYDTVEGYYTTERDYQLAVAELMQWEE